MKKTLKKQTGITLIALVITIIVLLILAGVSISMVIGENGILTQADEATIKTREASAAEDVELAWVSADSDYWNDWTNNSSVQKGDYFEAEDLNKYLVGKGTVSKVTANADGTTTVTYTSEADNMVYEIVVDANGNGTVTSSTHKSQVKNETLASKITAANYGDSVTNYAAENGYSDWKIFYSNGSNVFLIASDYVDKTLVTEGMDQYSSTSYPYGVYWNSSNSAVTRTTLQSMNQLNLFRLNATNAYELNASNINSRCVSTMLNENNWTGFKDTATGYGEHAIGGPTVEMWMASWNGKGQLYNTAETTKYVELKTQNGTNGYYVGPTSTEDLSTNAADWDYSIGGYGYNVGTDTDGYDDTLYFPHQSSVSNCYGYWLASPSAIGSNYVLLVDCNGLVVRSDYGNSYYGVRPVVSLSSEVLGEQAADGSWTLSK